MAEAEINWAQDKATTCNVFKSLKLNIKHVEDRNGQLEEKNKNYRGIYVHLLLGQTTVAWFSMQYFFES